MSAQNMQTKEPEKKLAFSDSQICFCFCASSLVINHFSIMNILIFQTTAMAFLSYCVLIFGGTLGFPGSLITIFAMFTCFLWTGRMTGTFLNPALVVACMLRKQKSVSLIKGLIYIFAEIVGSFIGTFIAWQINGNLEAPFQLYTTTNEQIGTFARQTIGSFIYCTLVLILISSDTTFVEIDLQIWFAIPLILVGVCGLLLLPLGINPAWSLSFQLAWTIYQDNFETLNYSWTFIVGPLVGGFLAGVFFEFIFRKFILAYKVELKRENEVFQQRMNELQRKKRKKRVSQIQLV